GGKPCNPPCCGGGRGRDALYQVGLDRYRRPDGRSAGRGPLADRCLSKLMLPLTPVVRDSAAVAVVDSHAARAMFARAGDAKAAVFRRSDMPIYNGQLVTLKCTFTVNGVKTDPDAITLSVKAPSGDVTTL